MGTVKSLLVESYADKSGSAALNEDAANHEIQQIRNSAAVSSAAVSSSMIPMGAQQLALPGGQSFNYNRSAYGPRPVSRQITEGSVGPALLEAAHKLYGTNSGYKWKPRPSPRMQRNSDSRPATPVAPALPAETPDTASADAAAVAALIRPSTSEARQRANAKHRRSFLN